LGAQQHVIMQFCIMMGIATKQAILWEDGIIYTFLRCRAIIFWGGMYDFDAHNLQTINDKVKKCFNDSHKPLISKTFTKTYFSALFFRLFANFRQP
jgi:hypothetical protein